MALKYFLEYNDTEEIPHRLEISRDDYVGDSTEVYGSITVEHAQVNSILDPIKGQGLRVSLQADSNITFDDLFTENEREYSVVYQRDGITKFQGWLNPEGWYEDFVNDKWDVSFDCVDGLGYLKNLAFVDDLGLEITGIRTQLEILSLALKRTGFNNNINVSINIFYTGLATTESILANVKISPKRYVKDDGDTFMNCDEVLRDILGTYSAIITLRNGEWYICRPNEMALNSSVTFFRYDSSGVALSPTQQTTDFAQVIGSQVNNFYPHHCNANQSFTNLRSAGGYRVNYKYGFLKELIDNNFLITDDGFTVPGFTIIDGKNITLPPAGGASVDFESEAFPVANRVDEFRTDSITVPVGTIIDLSFIVSFLSVSGLNDFVRGSYKIVLSDGIETYHLDENYIWRDLSVVGLSFDVVNGTSKTVSITSRETPISGDLDIIWQTFVHDVVDLDVNIANLGYVSVTTNESDATNIEGEIFTFERTDNPSSRVLESKEVFTGDNIFTTYDGILYKSDGVTQTSTWFRKDISEALPIIELAGSDVMRMNQSTIRIYNGDIYGFIDYLSVITIDGFDGVFGVVKYIYNTKSNTISLELHKMYGNEIADLETEMTFDYGEVVEPTIKG